MATTRGDETSFPRQQARTRRFSCGRPRNISIAADGSRIVFLRSLAGDDPVNCMWVIDVDGFRTRLVVDPRRLGDTADAGDLPPEERARRERARESASGIVAYGADRLLRRAAFVLGGGLFSVDLSTGEVSGLQTDGAVVDPRYDPAGSRIAYVCGGSLHVVEPGGTGTDTLVAKGDPGAGITWGLAEFVASEEMGRFRGYWWSPDGTALVAARVDNTPVNTWHIADPTDPARPATEVRYPAAGTANASVTLEVFHLGGDAIDVKWDNEAFPYLARVGWSVDGPLTLLVQSRDQGVAEVLGIDERTGEAEVLSQLRDEAWVDIVGGTPAWTSKGQLVTAAYVDDVMRVLVDSEPVSPPDVQVRGIVDAGDEIIFAGSSDPAAVQLWRISPTAEHEPELLTPDPGLHSAIVGGDLSVSVSSSMHQFGPSFTVRRAGNEVGYIDSFAATPTVDPKPIFLTLGDRAIRAALLYPAGHQPGTTLPVLMDPYGGPGHQRVIYAKGAYAESQWLADQGFAVLIADGRGTGGRGREWDRAVLFDLAEPALEDQVSALQTTAKEHADLDLSRVAIRGWSFGGFLAALAALRRPDVFHAAVAGAPVTDWRLYDTHYTERFLGHPDEHPDAYRRSSLIDDAANLTRPLLLIHGLSDDNVVFAHSVHLSRALFEAGRDHEILPLAGITHMTPQEVVAENLLLLQVRFLKRSLGMTG